MRFTVALLVLAAVGAGAMAFGQDGGGADLGPFAGKVVMLYRDGSPEAAIPLVDVRIEKIAGRDFIVGIGADSQTEGDWVKGVHFGVPLDRVSFFNTFSPEEYRTFCAKWGRDRI